jgi:hypothetical protein
MPRRLCNGALKSGCLRMVKFLLLYRSILTVKPPAVKCSISFASIFLRGTLEIHTSFCRGTVHRNVQCHNTLFCTFLQYSILHPDWPLISKFPKLCEKVISCLNHEIYEE